MAEDEQKGGHSPAGEIPPGGEHPSGYTDETYQPAPAYSETPPVTTDDKAVVVSSGAAKTPPRPPAPPSGGDGDDEDEGMLRMSFMEHLEELRMRIIRSLMGLGVIFILCILFANKLWEIVSEPAIVALQNLKFNPTLVQISPMDTFSIVWVKVPLLTSIFLASPWILYQVWAFIAPGLYKRERRWAAPFIICSAGLFILGGLFGYFIAFRYGLEFLLGIGHDIKITPMVSITEYFDLFVNVMLGIGLVFELPVLIFFLTLLHIVSPAFLLRHSRYAILIITIIAAIITPTPDVFNLMLFTIPMCLLYFMGIFAGYLLVLRRENRKFPWKPFLITLVCLIAFVGALVATMVIKFHYRIVPHWPFLVK
jgi:sec-independent protein translocase protein TatC